jgi:hypothetical protein
MTAPTSIKDDLRQARLNELDAALGRAGQCDTCPAPAVEWDLRSTRDYPIATCAGCRARYEQVCAKLQDEFEARDQ